MTPFGPTVVDPGDYTVTEFDPIEDNWFQTTTNPVDVTVGEGEAAVVEFGNVCIGAGGGKTLGFWSNKNGKAVMNDGGTLEPELALLRGLNLVGSAFNPMTYVQFRTWLLNATATNMAYMLSAQLAAMVLNVEAGLVSGSSLIYAPGTTSANSLGFATLTAVMREANTELGIHSITKSPSAFRTYQEALKNALDNANNNLNFVQATPCDFSFTQTEPVCDAGSGNTNAAYDAIPTDVEHCGPPSLGFEATQTNEFGDLVALDTNGGVNTKLLSLTVDFQSYGCSDSGHWYTADCVTTPGATFTIPGGITANIYDPGNLTTPSRRQP